MRRTPGRRLIAQRLRDEIFAGMRPGDWIGTEAQLAERFGVSRITMRDAVRVLESEGFIDVSVGVGGGLRVAIGRPEVAADALSAQLYLEDVSWRELVDAMHVIEGATARLAAREAGPDDIRRLRAIVNRPAARDLDGTGDGTGRAGQARPHDEEGRHDEAGRFTETALDFHLALAQIAGNRPLAAAVRAMRGAQRRLFAPETTAKTIASVTRMHARIVDAIEQHDPDAAAAAMSAHLDKLRSAAH